MACSDFVEMLTEAKTKLSLEHLHWLQPRSSFPLQPTCLLILWLWFACPLLPSQACPPLLSPSLTAQLSLSFLQLLYVLRLLPLRLWPVLQPPVFPTRSWLVSGPLSVFPVQSTARFLPALRVQALRYSYPWHSITFDEFLALNFNSIDVFERAIVTQS